jgi:hypothetical protein
LEKRLKSLNLWQNYPTTLIIAKRILFVNLNLFQILFQLDSETCSALQVDFKSKIRGIISNSFMPFALKNLCFFCGEKVC